MPNRRGLAWLVTLVVLATTLGSACGSSNSGATIDGSGSSFQDTFEQQVASDFAADEANGGASVSYTKTGSSDGKKSLADETVDFAGSDSPIKNDEEANFAGRTILYFPIMGGPIALAYKLRGVTTLSLSAETIAAIFQGTITRWDDDAVKADNPDAELPSTSITVVHRSDGSGITSNFTTFMKTAAPDAWKLGAGETIDWPQRSNFQGAEKSTGVTQVVRSTDGAITYADLADVAKARLDVAKVGNAEGAFIAPTPDAASKALGATEIADDLTYNPLNATADGAYPITSPTWILVDQEQKDAGRAKALRAYLTYVLTTGQAQAKALLYAPLPTELADKAIAQIDRIAG